MAVAASDFDDDIYPLRSDLSGGYAAMKFQNRPRQSRRRSSFGHRSWRQRRARASSSTMSSLMGVTRVSLDVRRLIG